MAKFIKRSVKMDVGLSLTLEEALAYLGEETVGFEDDENSFYVDSGDQFSVKLKGKEVSMDDITIEIISARYVK